MSISASASTGVLAARARWHLPLLSGGAVSALMLLLAAAARRRRRRRLDEEVLECDLLGVLLGDWPLLHFLAYRGWTLLLRTALHVSDACAAATKQRWTALHCAASEGRAKSVGLLLGAGGDVDTRDASGHTALAMAVAKGHVDVALRLLEARADASANDQLGLTPLHIAAVRGEGALVTMLIDRNAALEAAQTRTGSTPLLAACKGPRGLPALRPLLEARAEAGAACQGTRSTTLMLLTGWCSEEKGGADAAAAAAKLLLHHGADHTLVDQFGQTALHLACRKGAAALVVALCEGGAVPAAQDNDGTYPLQLLCQRCADHVVEEPQLAGVALEALLASEPHAAKMLDFGDASALHTVCQFVALRAKDASARPPLKLLRALLAARADVSLEEEGGWTPAHFLAGRAEEAHGEACSEILTVLKAEAHVKPGFWESWDPAKPRDSSNAKYLARRGGHHRLPPEERFNVLRGDVSLAGVAARLREGRSCKVVALLGAGASTSAGIPDFRSPGGLWTTEATRDVLSGPGFFSNPDAFWQKASELFEGRQPTKVHWLLAALHARGLLRRVYSQNIDGLEAAAGLPDELVVQCHGTVRSAVCCADARHPAMATKHIMSATHHADTDGTPWRAPRCGACSSLMRPEVVFFGEGLPEAYSRHWAEDLKECDLLLVVGTSLMVYPVAGLVKQVGPLVPRLLINRERAGVWREQGNENYRDACWEGECDVGAEELAKLVGLELA